MGKQRKTVRRDPRESANGPTGRDAAAVREKLSESLKGRQGEPERGWKKVGREARKTKMKLEGEKCADKSKTADVFCGSSSCTSIAWNNPASCSPPYLSCFSVYGGKLSSRGHTDEYRKETGKKPKARNCFMALGCFKSFPGDSNVTRVENHCWRVNLKHKEENTCSVATKKV